MIRLRGFGIKVFGGAMSLLAKNSRLRAVAATLLIQVNAPRDLHKHL